MADTKTAPKKSLHERTAFGEHEDGSSYLRASSQEDAGHIQDAAEKHGITLSHRKGPANHQGEKGVYSHFHMTDPADGQKIMDELRAMHGEQPAGDPGGEPAGTKPAEQAKPTETHVHVHLHQGDSAEEDADTSGRPVTKGLVKGHTRRVNGKVVQVHEYNNDKAYAHRKQHTEAVLTATHPLLHSGGGSLSSQAYLNSYTALNSTDNASDERGHDRAMGRHQDAAKVHREAAEEVDGTKQEHLAVHHRDAADAHDSAAKWHNSAKDHFGKEGDPKKIVIPQIAGLKMPKDPEAKPAESLHDKALKAAKAATGQDAKAMVYYSKTAHAASKEAEKSGKPEDHYIASSLHMAAGMSHQQAREDSDYADNGHHEADRAHQAAEKYHAEKAGDAKVSPKEMNAAADRHGEGAKVALPGSEKPTATPWHFDDATHRQVHSPDHQTYYRPSKQNPGTHAMNTVLGGKADPKAWLTSHYTPGPNAEEHPNVVSARESEAKEKAYLEKNPPAKAPAVNKDNWQPASGGQEKPFKARSGATLTYMHNEADPGKHAYYLHGEDRILSNKEAEEHMGDRSLESHPRLSAGAEEDRKAAHPKAKEALVHATETVGKLDTPHHSEAANTAFDASVKAAKSSHKANTTGAATDHLDARDDNYQASNDHAWAKKKATLGKLHEHHDAAGRAHAEAGNHHNTEYDKAHQSTIHEAIGADDAKNGQTEAAYGTAANEAYKHSKGLDMGGGIAPTAENHYAAHEAHTAAGHAAREHAKVDPKYTEAAERHEKDASWHKFLGDSKMKARDKDAKKAPRKVAKGLDCYLANADLMEAAQRWHVGRLDTFAMGKKPHELPTFQVVQQAIKESAHAGLTHDQVMDTLHLATGGNSAYSAAVLDWLNK